MNDQLPPNSEQLEQAALSCLLQDPAGTIPELSARFKCGSAAFFDLRHQLIYDTLLEMHGAGELVQVITLQERLKQRQQLEQAGGLVYLSSLPDAAPSSAGLDYYADQLAGLYMQRQILVATHEASTQVYDNQADAETVIKEIEAKLQTIREIRSTDVIVPARKAVQLLTTHLEERFHLQGRRSGVETGIAGLDKITDGLQFGEQTIIGARPSQGKTALATTIVRNACLLNGIPTLVITLEMSIQALCRRILANHARIPLGVLREGSFTEGDFKRFTAFNLLMAKTPIYFTDAISGTDSDRICHTIRRMAKAHGVKLVVIDYLQKIKAVGRHEKRTYEVAEVSGQLKAVAVETGVAMLTLAQLNREPEQQKGRAPRLSDLADSSQIERDGDCIVLLERNREQGRGHEARLYVAKQRDGEIGIVEAHFEGKFSSFENIAP